MALSLLCGGLGVAEASVHVVEGSETYEVMTTQEVKDGYGTKADVEANKNNIATLQTKTTEQGEQIAINKTNIATNKDEIKDLKDNKLNKDFANTTFATKIELGDKANTDLSNLTADGVTKIKNTMSEDMDLKANKAEVYSRTDAENTFATKTALNAKADTAALGEYAKTADVTTELEKKADKTVVTALVGRVGNLETTVNDSSNGLVKKVADLNKKTTKIDYDVASDTTNVNGMKVGDQVDMGGKELTNVGNINGINIGDAQVDMGGKKLTNVGTINGIDIGDAQVNMNDKNLTGVGTINGTAIGTKVEGNYIHTDSSIWGNMNSVDTQVKTNADNIKTNTTAITTLDTKVGKIDDRTGGIKRNTEDTQTTIEEKVTVNNSGDVRGVKGLSAETINTTGDATIGGKLNVTGASDLKGDVTLGTPNGTNKVTVNGTANFQETVKMGNGLNVTNGDTNLQNTNVEGNLKVTGTITTDKMVFGDKPTNYTEIDKGHITSKNAALAGDATQQSSSMEFDRTKLEVGVADKDSNGHLTMTADKTTIKNSDLDGKNYSEIVADKDSVQTTVKDEKGNTTSTKSSATEIRNYAKDKDGNESSIVQTGKDITNTAEKGTITSKAKDIVNDASGDMTNTVGGQLNTTVTGQATENFNGGLDTNVKGTENHTVTGDQNIHVTKNQTNKIDGNQENTIGGDQTTTVEGKVTENYTAGQETNVTGDQDIKVSGTQTTTATDINRNASSGMIDTIDNDYGTNKETKVAGETKTEVSIKGTGEKGEYIRGATQSRDYLINGTLKNEETKTVEATSSEVTDGTNKASTRQDAKNLAGSVTNGTETGISGIHANDDGSVSIDSAVAGGGMSSVINQKKDSITSAVGDGTNSTVILQDKDNVTIASSNGTVGIVGKDIVNNAQDTITNTAGTKITDTAGDSTVTTEKAKGTTFTKTGSTAYSTEAGAPTDTNIAGNHITTGRVDANELGVSDKDDQGNTAGLSVKAGEGNKGGIKGYATDKDGNKTYTKVTATENSFQVQDKNGENTNHQVNTKDKSENTITNGTKANTVTSTADGTTFNNSKANTAFEGGTYTDTTIKGNTITTGKVTMDYADVMKDLGVYGNATVAKDMTVKGNTTLGEAGKDTTLTVNSKATFKEQATFENGAEVKNGLTVSSGGLNVTGESTFNDKVTMKNGLVVTGGVASDSFTVKGTDIKIDSSGINAGGTVISNVADGSISEGSKDAVNGGQLYQVKNDLEGKVNKVGANAAAMANLHPMEFDPDSKWNIAAAMGNYGSETATAIGAFYRPNEDVMVNFSTAFGTGENMVGGGVSVRLGKGSNKLSRQESNALKAQVNDLTARMDALLSVLNPNMSKDFPDVPENHWAYEAVSRLAGNDIVQGYPDGEFHGDRTMTRYEMAEIIYNALSRGAEAERELVEEFKPELQAMAASEKATAERAEG